MAFIIFFQIRPLFEEHGNVIEVASIKDKKTGQPQGMHEFCFIVRYFLLYLSYFRFAERLIGANLSSSSSQFVFDTSFALVGFGCHLHFLMLLLSNKERNVNLLKLVYV